MNNKEKWWLDQNQSSESSNLPFQFFFFYKEKLNKSKQSSTKPEARLLNISGSVSESAMTLASDEACRICSHCERDIPSSNIDLHYAHCVRNLEKCKVCGDMVPKKHAEEHYVDNHAPVSCSLCSETMDRDILTIHKGENCPQRMVTCDFCDFPLPAADLPEHQEVCGNRTELCSTCRKYVRLRERYNHLDTCNVVQDPTVGTSRDARAAERPRGPQRRRQPNDFSRRGLVFTIALTGVAVLLGSLFLQKKDSSQVN